MARLTLIAVFLCGSLQVFAQEPWKAVFVTEPGSRLDYILSRGDDMIVLVMVTAGLTRGDKFETYTIFPRLGTGFLTETSSFLGIPALKAVAVDDPRVPAASAKAFPLRRIDKIGDHKRRG